MASKSKKAQEQLAELEKLSAPFEDQLVEAAKFVGVDLDSIARYSDDATGNRISGKSVQYFGREEWLLRWLLKKLLVPRKTASSWSLLLYLLRTIPVTNGAKILAERGFVSVLKLELEGLVKGGQEATPVPANEEKKSSKKRKRSGEVVASSTAQDSTGLSRLLESIYAAVQYVTEASDVLSGTETNKDGRGAAFSAEYMQKSIRTSPEEAAQVLGAWMSLCGRALLSVSETSGKEKWLSPFIRIWICHTTDTTAYLGFSLHCTQPLLALLRGIKSGHYLNLGWNLQLEQLLARNIMNPAKSAAIPDPESELLSTLTKTSVIQDLSNAPILFEIAIRSIKPHGSRRRRASDDAWLLHVFKTLKESMPANASKDGKAISDMLQLAIEYKVMLELQVLRAITSEFALPEANVSWQLVATMIKLDANVFLISEKESNDSFLNNLLARITIASVSQDWSEISQHVVSEVVVPLMNEFAKARDLSGFMRHWHAQLVEFEKLRAKNEEPVTVFSAWEDNALHVELRKRFEVSLTIQQIEQILEWLTSELTSSPNATCVLLDAIAGSLVGEAVVDAVGLRLYKSMFDGGAWTELDERFKWRSVRILSRTSDCTTYANINKILESWQELSQRISTSFETLDNAFGLEILRVVCSLWSAPQSGSVKDLVKPLLLDVLRRLTSMSDAFISDIKGGVNVGSEHRDSESNKVDKSRGWMTWSLMRCVFVEYPKTLLAGEALEGGLKSLIQNLFWLSSATTLDGVQCGWLKLNDEAFPALWLSALGNDNILNSSALKETMIGVMLLRQTDHNNPSLMLPATNSFAVKALLQVRMENLNKKQREAILKGWLPTGDARNDEQNHLTYTNALHPAVLSLKIRMMEYAMFYEGMDFEMFVHLAKIMAGPEDPNKQVSLVLLKELCRKTVDYVHAIPNEARNKAYILSAFKIIQKKIKKAAEKLKYKLDYSFIAIFEVVLKILLDAKISVIDVEDLDSAVSSFKSHLLGQLKILLHDLRKGKVHCDQDTQLAILSIVDALSNLGVNASDLEGLRNDASKFCSSDTSELNIGTQLKTFIFVMTHSPATEPVAEADVNELSGDVKTGYGRQSIVQKAKILASGNNKQKLELLKAIFGAENRGLPCPDKLLAARQVIISLEDSGKSEDELSFDLSEAYTILSSHLPKTTSMVQFSIISETLQLMLHTKPRSISQYNIDATLGSITILCSRQGPSLNSARANAIYTHACHLLRSVILHHRLKLQGHMHLIVQTLLSLLRCLFRPLPHSSPLSSKYGAPPPWLPTTSSLTPQTAEAFTRLLTLLCDPSESSVRGKRHNILVNESEKWKRVTGWHMQFVLMEYVALQLEMCMESSLREKLIPGIWAVLDTGSVEGRRAVASRLDGSQRAVFGGLVREWSRFGKWGGS